MDKPDSNRSVGLRLSTGAFLGIEHGLYITLGCVLSITAVIALVNATTTLWHAVMQWNGNASLLEVMDELLFVLMLAEILHTVRVSIRSGSLTGEPFLIVGLIASIRRVLVITLESSQTSPSKAPEAMHEDAFRASMIELGVLGALILIMVMSIYLLRRAGGDDVKTPG